MGAHVGVSEHWDFNTTTHHWRGEDKPTFGYIGVLYIYIYILCAIHTICFLQNAPFYLLPKSKRAVLRSFSSNAVVLLCFYLPPHSRPLWDEGPMAQVLSFGLRIRCSDARRTSSKPLKVAKTRPNTAIPTRSTGKLGLLCLGSEKMREKGNGLVKKIYLRFG